MSGPERELYIDRFGRTPRTLIVVILLTIYCLIDNYFLKQPLYDMTIPYSLWIRENWGESKAFNVTIEIIAQMSDKYGMLALYPVAFLLLPIHGSMSLISGMFIGLCTNIMLKFIFLDPRPFMTTPGLVPSKCLFDYGNPSGHSTHSIMIYFGFYIQYTRAFGHQMSSFTKNLMFYFCALIFLLVAFSRIATGSHTINQILHGWVWGAANFYLFNFNYSGAFKRLV
jgi:membrane-associated phospholipid phosphatase